jgi:hypothetical protein
MFRALHQGTFECVFMAFAIVAPMLLVTLAFVVAPNSIERVRIVLAGCEMILSLLALALILRTSYRLGRQNAVISMNPAPGSRGVAVA